MQLALFGENGDLKIKFRNHAFGRNSLRFGSGATYASIKLAIRQTGNDQCQLALSDHIRFNLMFLVFVGYSYRQASRNPADGPFRVLLP